MTTTEDHSGIFSAETPVFRVEDSLLEGRRYRLPSNDGMDGKSHLHTSATTLAGSIRSTHGLGIWAQDRVAWAMAQRPDLCALLQSVPLDDVETIREVRAKAEIISEMDSAANLGTATHNILHRVDRGEPIESLAAMFHQDIRAYQDALTEYGLTVLPELIERVVRMRDYDIAGRFDNIMLERDCSMVIADIKTKGNIDSIHEVATQLAAYANADEMFDEVTGRFVPMLPVRRDYALMIHIVPGSGVCTIRKIDIRAGLWSVELAKNIRAWHKITHLSSPYVGVLGVKPADSATITRGAGILTAVAPKPMNNGSGTYDPAAHSAQIAAGIAAQQAVPAPDPAQFGAPAGVPAPAAYTPQQLPPKEPQLPVHVAPIDPQTEAEEIAASFKAKAELQAYARRYGITDLQHHKIHIAKSIVKVRNDRRAAGLPAEPDKINSSESAPRTMAETGLPPAPAQPPGQPIITTDLTEATVLADIERASAPEQISQLWARWTNTYGHAAWSGKVQAAADARYAQLTSVGQLVGEIPF